MSTLTGKKARTADIENFNDTTGTDGRTYLQDQQREVIDLLGKLGGKGVSEEDLIFQGTKFILPERMNLEECIDFLGERMEQEERTTSYSRVFRYRPYDGAHATQAALRRVFGAVGAVSTWTMFGEEPPQLVTINVGPKETEQIPWGALTLGILPGATIQLGAKMDPEWGPLFAVTIDGPRKYRHQIEGVFRIIEEELRSNSIFKGAAIDGRTEPNYLDLDGVDPKRVIYTDAVTDQFEANVWSLLRYTQQTVDNGLPLKRAVLLEGPYGCGKTLGAYLTAQIARANGWTFIMCRPGRDDLDLVLQTASLYPPAVVFYEDIDNITTPEDGSEDTVTKLLDRFDGMGAKGSQVMMILTTNHPENIHKGMVRPGRLDAVIHIAELDQGGIERMIKVTVPDHLLDKDLDYDAIGIAMKDFLPSFVKEAIDRALRYALARTKGNPKTLVAKDFIDSANGLRPQLELMEGAKEISDRDPVAVALAKVVKTAVLETGVQYPHAVYNLVDVES